MRRLRVVVSGSAVDRFEVVAVDADPLDDDMLTTRALIDYIVKNTAQVAFGPPPVCSTQQENEMSERKHVSACECCGRALNPAKVVEA